VPATNDDNVILISVRHSCFSPHSIG
jgi:hypothetical protein